MLGICPFLSAATTRQGGEYCQGSHCELAVLENGKFKCCAFVEIANHGKKPEDQTTNIIKTK